MKSSIGFGKIPSQTFEEGGGGLGCQQIVKSRLRPVTSLVETPMLSLPLVRTTRNIHVALFPLLSVKTYFTIDSPIRKDELGVWVLDTRTCAWSLSVAVGSVHTMSTSFTPAGTVSNISDGQPWITGGVVSRSVQVNNGQDFHVDYHSSDPMWGLFWEGVSDA